MLGIFAALFNCISGDVDENRQDNSDRFGLFSF